MALRVQEDGRARDIPIRAGRSSTCRRACRTARSAGRIGRPGDRAPAPGPRAGRTAVGTVLHATTACTRSASHLVDIERDFRACSSVYRDDALRTCALRHRLSAPGALRDGAVEVPDGRAGAASRNGRPCRPLVLALAVAPARQNVVATAPTPALVLQSGHLIANPGGHGPHTLVVRPPHRAIDAGLCSAARYGPTHAWSTCRVTTRCRSDRPAHAPGHRHGMPIPPRWRVAGASGPG